MSEILQATGSSLSLSEQCGPNILVTDVFPPQPVAGITNCCEQNTITVALPWKAIILVRLLALTQIKLHWDFWLHFATKTAVLVLVANVEDSAEQKQKPEQPSSDLT